MTNTIGFPELFLKTFEINNIAFDISIGSFSLSVHWYGVIIATGFILATIYAMKRSRSFGSNPDEIIDMLLWALPLCIVGARAYYVLNSWSYYSQNPGEIIKIWNGGLAIYGAVIMGIIVVWVFCKKRKINPFNLLDIGALGLFIGQTVGRWANFVNAEAFGGETSLPWGMSINGGAPVHPTFLYESIWNLIGFTLIHFYSKKRKFPGEVFLMYTAWYGLGRFFIEGMRTDSLYIGSSIIRISQLVALLSVVAAGGVLIYMYKTKKYIKASALPTEEEGTNGTDN